MKKAAIIVAGGSGSRMKTNVPKQFIVLHGQPVLMHTLQVFHDYLPEIELILALPEAHVSHWERLCHQFGFTVAHQVVVGGNTRFQSVKNALTMISESYLVAVHDGVRPLVNKTTIASCFSLAQQRGAAIPVVPVNDSVRRVENGQSVPVNRQSLRLIQTPQVFRSQMLIAAYRQKYRTEFTDDASVVEYAGHRVFLVDGNPENIKITTKNDLIVAEALLKNIK